MNEVGIGRGELEGESGEAENQEESLEVLREQSSDMLKLRRAIGRDFLDWSKDQDIKNDHDDDWLKSAADRFLKTDYPKTKEEAKAADDLLWNMWSELNNRINRVADEQSQSSELK